MKKKTFIGYRTKFVGDTTIGWDRDYIGRFVSFVTGISKRRMGSDDVKVKITIEDV